MAKRLIERMAWISEVAHSPICPCICRLFYGVGRSAVKIAEVWMHPIVARS